MLSNNINNYIKITITLSSFLVVIFCIWSINKGFEITDEAYYLLLASHPTSVELYISAQQWITGPIWQLTQSLILFRAAGLFLLLSSSLLLAFSICKTLSKIRLSNHNHILIYASSITCSLLYAATINLSPCYNLLASTGAYFAAGLTLLAIYENKRWCQILFYILTGIAISIEFINKPSSGIATLFLLSLWIIFLSNSTSNRLINISVIIVSVTSSILILLFNQTSLLDVEKSLTQGLELFRMVQTESSISRLFRYTLQFFRYSFEALLSYSLVVVTAVLYLRKRSPFYAGLVLSSLLITVIIGDYYLGGAKQYLSIIKTAFILLFLILLISYSAWKNNKSIIILIIGLIALPYSVAFGTGNSIFTQIIVSLAPWGAALALVMTLNFSNRTDYTLVIILFVCFNILISLQIITSGFRDPYHMQEPLINQSNSIEIGAIGSVNVDLDTARFVTDLNTAVDTCNISKHVPFIGLYNVPGVALALDVVPVLTPWINNVSQAETLLSMAPDLALNPYVVAIRLNKDGSFPSMPSHLPHFPDRFHYCGEATYPFHTQKIQIWYYDSQLNY